MKKTIALGLIWLAGCTGAEADLRTSAEHEEMAVETTTAASENIDDGTTAPQAWWRPKQGASWQIQFTGEVIDTGYDVEVYFLDLFETTPALVEELHEAGRKVVCYFSAGSWENWRPDKNEFPPEVLGNDYEDWPGERWLDIREIERLAPIMSARFDLCAVKGFDGADPDNVDGYSNATGFDISQEDAIRYAEWLADQAHSLGLGIGLKNAPELAENLLLFFDWDLTEDCFAQGWCEDMDVFLDADKAVFDIEYTDEDINLDDFCPTADELGISAILKNRDLDGWVELCI